MKTSSLGIEKTICHTIVHFGTKRRLAALFAIVVILANATITHAGSGEVLPPAAQPLGYSLDGMATAVANFSITGNDPAYYPETPFQIIYRHPGNAFTLKPGTFLYVKFFYVDDAPPTLGTFPVNKSSVEEYIFGRDQLGGHDLEIEVDGVVTSISSPGYVGGPVATPNSPDGSNQLLQIGAFLSPLSKGTHTIIARGVFDGQAILDVIGGPFANETSYTITVR